MAMEVETRETLRRQLAGRVRHGRERLGSAALLFRVGDQPRDEGGRPESLRQVRVGHSPSEDAKCLVGVVHREWVVLVFRLVG
jgi:hypothetical protein